MRRSLSDKMNNFELMQHYRRIWVTEWHKANRRPTLEGLSAYHRGFIDALGATLWKGGDAGSTRLPERQLTEAVRLLRRCSSGAYDNAVGRRDAGRWLLDNFPLKANTRARS